ncbi:MAG: hypothetical protein HC883_00105 [Bdellovibrionaceae bacterium]|nr:hypothetical protein [Pseudobdellovibrionaceae bacterium]
MAIETLDAPFRDSVVEANGLLTTAWTWFVRSVTERLFPLGVERSFPLANNQAAAADVVGLKVNSRGVSQAIVEFLVQRVTTSTGAVELIEAGYFTLSYSPTSETWTLSQPNPNLPEDSGVTFTVTATGQVQYTSSNVAGTPSISRVVWRMRTLAGKSEAYSSQGAR